jgi:hypothetical protein
MRVSPRLKARTEKEAIELSRAVTALRITMARAQGAEATAGRNLLARHGSPKSENSKQAFPYYPLDFTIDATETYRFDETCQGRCRKP